MRPFSNRCKDNNIKYFLNLFVLSLRKILYQVFVALTDVPCKDLSWYDVTATGDFASKMTEDLNKMQDGMGEKVFIIVVTHTNLSI